MFLGIGSLFMGFSRLNSKVLKKNGIKKTAKTDNIKEENNSGINEIIKLKNQDTDKDGLSDYDEINIYGTSIYLPDSDSDGYSDKEEVESGNDPNCPAGQDCSLPKQELVGQDQQEETKVFNDYSELINNMNSAALATPNVNSNANAEKILSGQASLEELKAMLLDAGMSPSDLSKIPDEEIWKMYQEMLKKSSR